MKKVLLTAMAILTLASASAFGMYGDNSDWIDFLVHGNQLRARMDRLGFVLGNGTIKGTFGFKNASGGLILEQSTVNEVGDNNITTTKTFYNFTPVVSAGIGYTTEAFGIGVGYNYRYIHDPKYTLDGGTTYDTVKGITKNGVGLSVHTPVIVFNALNNSLRIAVPIQIAAKNNDFTGQEDNKYLGVSMDPQIRYYPGLDFLKEFRLTLYYGMNQWQYVEANTVKKGTVSSFGFDFRTYFGATVGDVALTPFIRITYNTALDKHTMANAGITAGSGLKPLEYTADIYDSNPWNLTILPTLGLSANSDFVSLYLEAGLGYKAVNTGHNKVEGNTDTGINHMLGWKTYGEIYITPVKDLEWYFEAEIGNTGVGGAVSGVTSANSAVGGGAFDFAAGTGITWYLPSLNGAE